MAILRNSYVMFQRTEPSSDDADSGPVRLVPVDGDTTEDANQRIFGFIYVEQSGAGSVRVEVLGSFGDGVWIRFGDRTLTSSGAYILGYADLDTVPPYVRVRASAEAPDGSEEKPTFTIVFRFTSNAPFRGSPADVPVVVERAPTGEVFPNEPPPEGP